jgi:uncharacterized protein
VDTQEATDLIDKLDDETVSEKEREVWGNTCDGKGLKAVLLACSKWLDEHIDVINALNVFPVPDGDTGTNMSHTFQAAVAKLNHLEEDSADRISQVVAKEALLGSRGNSGVILSQIIRGLYEALKDKASVTAVDLTRALVKAKEFAYKAIPNPAEGTILTVVRDAADAAEEAVNRHNNIYYVLRKTVAAAKTSVERTPTLLASLREAGVVDAGGHGFYVILEGALRFVRGESLTKTEFSEIEKQRPDIDKMRHNVDPEHELDAYGYCTNFLVQALNPVNFEEVRGKIVEMGNSAVVVGDSNMVKVHIHTDDPGKVLSYAVNLGTVSQIKIDNMQLQFEETHGSKTKEPFYEEDENEHTKEIGIVSVVSGTGLRSIFKNFGVDKIVSGGQTMNPSVKDLLKAVDSLPHKTVLILPNNKNIIMAAKKVPELTSKAVAIIPTATIPQGLAAMQTFSADLSFAENVEQMTDAISQVVTGEVTKAVRTANVNGLAIQEGQWIGLVDDVLRVSGSSKEDIVFKLLDTMKVGDKDLITVFYGEKIGEVEAQTIQAQIQERYPKQEVEIAPGGQPHYHYIISAE